METLQAISKLAKGLANENAFEYNDGKRGLPETSLERFLFPAVSDEWMLPVEFWERLQRLQQAGTRAT